MTRDELRLRATVVSHFDVDALDPDGKSDEAVEALLAEDCSIVRTPGGGRAWALDPAVRRVTARAAGAEALSRAWAERPSTTAGSEQWAIDAVIGDGDLPPLTKVDREQLTALEAVTRWLDGVEGLPGAAELQRRLRFAELLQPVRQVATDHFVGRRALLQRLRNDVRGGDTIVFVHGVGGVGKSALVARHLLWAVEHETAVVYLNFDDSALDPAVPETLVRAIAEQLSWQLAGSADDLAAVARLARDAIAVGAEQLAVQSRGMQVKKAPRSLLSRLRGALPSEARLLVVFDTVEEVQRRDVSAIDLFASLVAEWVGLHPTAHALCAGRAPMPELIPETPGAQREARYEPLHGLERDEALDLLEYLVGGPFTRAQLDAVIEQVGTSPLTLRLAAEILRRAPDEELPGLRLQSGQIEGVLYDRLLGHIEDPDVRAIAPAALVLRRVTPELIARVLAPAVGLRLDVAWQAEQLFDGLAREAMLVTGSPSDPRVLTHRSDVRAMMLELLTADDPVLVRSVNRRTKDLLTGRDDLEERTEAMYHRLMLGQRERTLDQHWDPELLLGLVPSLDELPPSSKAYLAARSEALSVSEEDLRAAETESRRRLVLRHVEGLVADGRALEALNILTHHVEETRDHSPALADARVQVLELVGSLSEALTIAENERARADRRADADAFILFTFHVARLAERTYSLHVADDVLEEAIHRVEGRSRAPSNRLLLLRLVVARLALARRTGVTDPARTDSLKRAAIALYDELEFRAVRGVPGLLRDVAAEVGAQAPHISVAALRAVGITGKRDTLASVVASAETLERSELGERVSEVLDAADADDTEELSEAVAHAFAGESDEAFAFEADHEPMGEGHDR